MCVVNFLDKITLVKICFLESENEYNVSYTLNYYYVIDIQIYTRQITYTITTLNLHQNYTKLTL